MCAWWVPPAHAAGECVPDASTACIQGRIRTADGDPATGVTLTVEGKGFTGEAITDDEGRWAVEV
ncbi:MAG: carboxypeptidase regulatory-like domain-containing protein, partial [Actinomycetales bacterium]|nr:carboxypeptidase regulatory-like domain-containing protein [Actinomycetales bacterium]